MLTRSEPHCGWLTCDERSRFYKVKCDIRHSFVRTKLPLPPTLYSAYSSLKAPPHQTRQVCRACLSTAAPRRRPGRQLRLAARPPTRSDVVRHEKCKHAVDSCVRLNLNLFTKRDATTVIYRLSVQTLPDGLETQFLSRHVLSCLAGGVNWALKSLTGQFSISGVFIATHFFQFLGRIARIVCRCGLLLP